MSLDAQLIIADALQCTASGAQVTNEVKVSQVDDPNSGNSGRPNRLKMIVNTAYASAATGTITFTVTHCSASGGTYASLGIVKALTKAALTAGTIIYDGGIPGTLKQFVQVALTKPINLTAGKFSAFFY